MLGYKKNLAVVFQTKLFKKIADKPASDDSAMDDALLDEDSVLGEVMIFIMLKMLISIII